MTITFLLIYYNKIRNKIKILTIIIILLNTLQKIYKLDNAFNK